MMKQEVLEVLEVRNAKTRKIGTPDVKSRKYNGSPNLKLKMVKTEPRQKIRQLLRACIPLDELKQLGKVAQSNS
ncbi:hypothetical protein ABIE26_003590 [Pedobacter africanus]|uniref:hypothetical protein n=1 Tax=Pedobacter africanus TaxID=151894 RepID=UPI0033974272